MKRVEGGGREHESRGIKEFYRCEMDLGPPIGTYVPSDLVDARQHEHEKKYVHFSKIRKSKFLV